MFDEILLDKKERANVMYTALLEHLDKIKVSIELMPEGDHRQLWETYHRSSSLIAELYGIHALTISSILELNLMIKPLLKRTFGDKPVDLEYKLEGESLDEVAKKYKQMEPTINWMDKDLKDKAKDTEDVNNG